MALSPNASNQSARNILGRPAQYSWMHQNPILSQPPLRASGKHLQRQAPTPIASDPAALSYQSPATIPIVSSPTQDSEVSSPLHEALQPSPVQEACLVQEDAVPDTSNSRNFLPSPTPSDHDKSPSPPATRQPPNEPTAHRSISQPATHQSPSEYTLHRSPAETAARLPGNRRPASTTSSSRQPSTSTPILQPPRASNPPTAHARLPHPNTNNAPPFGPQWSAVFSSADCIKRISDFVAAHENLNEADLERLGILYDATTQNDWYFGILLMLLACHSLNLPSLQPIQVYLPQNSLPMFARLLGEQSDAANSLSHEVQLFISSFPKPLDELRACLTDQSFGLAIRNIASCLHQITLNLDRVLLQSRHAETLPTVHDLIASLGIRSLLFQRATFRFLLRNTWGSDSGPMAESAMREFTVEQQRFGIEGGQSPEMRLHQQKLYRDIFHQHIRATHSPHALMTPTTNPLAVNTATAAQQPALASTVSTFHDTGTAQSQLPSQLPSPRPGQHRDQRFPRAQMVGPTGSQVFLTAQMEMQMRMQQEMQMRAQAQAQAQAQVQVQSTFPGYFQNQPQGPSLPAAYYQNPGSTFSPQFQQGPHQSVHQNNTAMQDVAQVQALMQYQQQTHPQQMQPQQPVLASNYPPTPSITTQGPRPYQARSDPPPRLFFPEPNSSVPQPANPDYRRSALHQAHLRSPVLVPKIPATPASDAPNDHYRRVVGFALPPHRLAITPVQEIPFQLSPQAIGRLLKVKVSIDGDPPCGKVDVDSITLRLRCCQVAPSQPLPAENRWVLLDGSWPVQAYFTVNQQQLEPRRKLHHGKYLPIDITHCVGGSNKLVVRINRSKYDKSPFNYAVAIEAVGFATRSSIKETCMKRVIPSEQILDSIKKSLTIDDEEIVMQSNLTLQLYEPFSNAKIFDLPVRSQDCLHKQAFDLDVFLDTRLEQQSKPPKGRISKVDAWRCPICKADSRPQRLIVDGFLMAVRESLAAKNMLKTRAINVESDGSWTPVHEAHDEESEDEATPVPKNNVEIIEIDDD